MGSLTTGRQAPGALPQPAITARIRVMEEVYGVEPASQEAPGRRAEVE